MKIEVSKVGIRPTPPNILLLKSETIVGAHYEKLRLDAISISACHLKQCVFDDVHAESVNLGGGLSQSTYEDCFFSNCDFIFGAVGNVRLQNCRFRRCNLTNLVSGTLEVVGCTFEDTRIKRGAFHATSSDLALYLPVRDRNEFYDNDFSSAKLVDVDFRAGIDLYAQRLPTGESYIFVGDTCQTAALAQILVAQDLRPGESARLKSTISLLKFYCSTGQKQQLLATQTLGSVAKHIREALGEICAKTR